MSAITLFFTTTLALCLGLMLSSVDGQCCPNRGDFQCCGRGPCNFFCCNCDRGCAGGCDFNPTNAIGLGLGALGLLRGDARRKRGYENIQAQPISQYDATVNAFESVDLNHDRVIDFHEGLAYLKNVTVHRRSVSKRSVKREDVDKFVLQFESIDANGDGVIEPHEFDRTLA